ncbi:MAG TPA: hypothetical protein VIH99_07270 [Bdellovibrionota bacterium]|jgi:hypothetical protein
MRAAHALLALGFLLPGLSQAISAPVCEQALVQAAKQQKLLQDYKLKGGEMHGRSLFAFVAKPKAKNRTGEILVLADKVLVAQGCADRPKELFIIHPQGPSYGILLEQLDKIGHLRSKPKLWRASVELRLSVVHEK